MQLSVDDKLSMIEQDVDVTNDSVAQENIRLLQVRKNRSCMVCCRLATAFYSLRFSLSLFFADKIEFWW